MKTLFKSALLFIMTVALLAMAVPSARAATLLPTALTGGTNNVALNATNSYANAANTLTIANSRLLTLESSFKSVDTNVCNVVFNFDASIDNAKWVTNSFQWVIAANGTAQRVTITNLDLGATLYLRLNSVVNTNSSVPITNVFLSGCFKNGI